ncbi:uncharacterized protein LOC129989468 isoform X1 [Argiope bruennichi]|uniref:uncharacterized protein LOC129989468 isoform X1 n=1 Tax=Argiope bruennichi TaxID=94029 RepID=UPI0024951012|nr:uncharacterized protein LOC129989468 isoform X1 [Argiope bruennichi]
MSQDSWETYEDSEEYYEYEEPINLEEAKKYFCSQIVQGFKDCLRTYYEKQLPYYDSCYEKIGLKSKNFLDAVDEACLPETPVDVGKKFQACKIEIQMAIRNQKVSLGTGIAMDDEATVFKYLVYCLPVREHLLDEGWLQYFLAGPVPL